MKTPPESKFPGEELKKVHTIAGRAPQEVFDLYQSVLGAFKSRFLYRASRMSQDGFVAAVMLEFLSQPKERQREILECRLRQLERVAMGEGIASILSGGGEATPLLPTPPTLPAGGSATRENPPNHRRKRTK